MWLMAITLNSAAPNRNIESKLLDTRGSSSHDRLLLIVWFWYRGGKDIWIWGIFLLTLGLAWIHEEGRIVKACQRPYMT